MPSFLHALIGGNPLDLPGLGQDNNGLTVFFPLSFGETVNDLANALNVPVDSILAVNPGLQADSPLSVSQVVGLPDDQVNQIVQNMNLLSGRAYVPTPTPVSPSPSQMPPPSSVSSSYIDQSLNGTTSNVVIPTLRALASELDAFEHSRQTVLIVPQIEDDAQGWIVSASVNLPAYSSGPTEPLASSTSLASPAPADNQPSATASPSSTPINATTSTTSTTPVSNNPGNVSIAASSVRQNQNEDVFNFMQAANAARAAQDRQRNPGTDVPPPPMDPRWFAGQFTSNVPGGVSITPPAVATNAANLPNSPTALQLMALLMAQPGGSLTIGASSSAPQQAQPYIDPQALAAFAAGMRATKVVDLGAGRSMAFSLVRDRLQRVDPIGQEDRAVSRRTSGDGLEEVRVSRPDKEDVEQTDEQREQGRRRRAAIAAMRRRRHARSRRCRYWRGSRSILRGAAKTRYPKGMDWTEFRGRQPPRYMWNVGGDG